MENKNIEFSVDHREYQMALIMNLPKNTPKSAMKVICEIQKERDFLLEQNEKLKENYKAVLKTLYNTEDTDHDLLDDCGDICEDIGNLKEEKYENNEFRQELGRIMDKHYLCREGEIDVVFENTLDENERLKQNQLTEENAMEYIYENSGQYETWIEGSDLYKKLKEDNEKLKKYKIFENELLIGEVDKLKAEHEKLKYWRDHDCESPWEAIVMIKELTDENKKLQNYSGCHPPPQMKL